MQIITKPDGNRYWAFNRDKGAISNEIVGISAVSRSGKSNLANVLAYQIWKKEKRTVIYLTEKVGDPYANAFCHFYPNERWQMELMDKMQIPKVQPIPVKLYHPFTFGMGKRNQFPFSKLLPKINLYTISTKSLTEEDWSIILLSRVDSPSVYICKEATEKLKENENLFDLIWNIAASEEKIENYDKDFFLPIKEESKQKHLPKIKRMLSVFKHHYFIDTDNNEKNLNWSKILNDNEHWHFFSDRWIYPNKRCAYFDIYKRLEGIDEALNTGKIRHQIVLVIEEIKALLPSGEQTIYEKMLSSKIIELLTRIATKAFVIITTQSLMDTDLKILNSITGEIALGKQGLNEMKRFIKDYGFGVAEQELLYSLELHSGRFVIWGGKEVNDEGKKLSETAFKAYITPFKVAEQGMYFFQEYRKQYPDKLANHMEEFIYFKSLLEKSIDRNKHRTELKLKQEKAKKEQEKQKDTENKEVKQLRKQVQQQKQLGKEEQIKLIRELNSQGLSNRQIAVRVGRSHSYINKVLKNVE